MIQTSNPMGDNKKQILIRVIADLLMLGISLAMALLVRFYVLYGIEGLNVNPAEYAKLYKTIYIKTIFVLIGVGITNNFLFGFYNKGRSYASKFKAIIIMQSVSLTFLLFALFGFLLPNLFYVPRGVLIIAWILSTVMFLGSRLWSSSWRKVVKSEISEKNLSLISEIRDENLILVIGGGGYIGSSLLKKLLNGGFNVKLLDAFVFGKEPIREVEEHQNLEIIEGDFREVGTVVKAMSGVGSVVHLGGIVGDPACAHDEELTLEINLMATRIIAEVAKAHKVKRFVFASTCSVYGANDMLLDEKSSLNPVSLYAVSKIASEEVLHEISDESFLPTILRFGTIYGFSGRIRFDLVINLLTAKAITNGKITLFGGDQWRPFVHVEDAAEGVFKALTADYNLVKGETFNVGSNEQNYTLEQVAHIIQKLVPGSEVIEMGSDSDKRNYRVCFDKINRTLQFTPTWTVDRGILQVIEAIKSGEVKDYTETKYSNIRTITDDKQSQLTKLGGWERKMVKDYSRVK